MASMSLSSRVVASRTTPAGFPPSGALEKAVYRSTSGRGAFVVMLVATWGGPRPFPDAGGGGDGRLRRAHAAEPHSDTYLPRSSPTYLAPSRTGPPAPEDGWFTGRPGIVR